MTDGTERVTIASPAWVDIARTVLEKLVSDPARYEYSYAEELEMSCLLGGGAKR